MIHICSHRARGFSFKTSILINCGKGCPGTRTSQWKLFSGCVPQCGIVGISGCASWTRAKLLSEVVVLRASRQQCWGEFPHFASSCCAALAGSSPHPPHHIALTFEILGGLSPTGFLTTKLACGRCSPQLELTGGCSSRVWPLLRLSANHQTFLSREKRSDACAEEWLFQPCLRAWAFGFHIKWRAMAVSDFLKFLFRGLEFSL